MTDVKYKSADFEAVDYDEELRKILKKKYVGCTIRSGVGVVEIRTTVDLEPSEKVEVEKLVGKGMKKG